MILVENSDTGRPRSVTIRMKFLFEYIDSGIQFYYKQNNKKHQYFWKDLKYFFIFVLHSKAHYQIVTNVH